MTEKVKMCGECGDEVDMDTLESLYECPECGNTFGKSEGNGPGHICPDCNKFSSKIGQTHEGCNGNSDDFEEKFKCEKCDEIYDTEQEAIDCKC